MTLTMKEWKYNPGERQLDSFSTVQLGYGQQVSWRKERTPAAHRSQGTEMTCGKQEWLAVTTILTVI